MSALTYATLRAAYSGRTTRLKIQVEDNGYAWVSYKNFKAAQKRIGGGQVWFDTRLPHVDLLDAAPEGATQ
jgi:hypothetical protein